MKLKPYWTLVKDKMPEERIRVIGAEMGFVIGDLFYGYADGPTFYNEASKCRHPVEKWNEKHWRYSQDNALSRIPTHWMNLPKPPPYPYTSPPLYLTMNDKYQELLTQFGPNTAELQKRIDESGAIDFKFFLATESRNLGNLAMNQKIEAIAKALLELEDSPEIPHPQLF